MSWHPTDDDLVAYLYGDDLDGAARRIEAHLSACAACRAACAEFQEVFGTADALVVPEPDEAFEGRIWAHVSSVPPHAGTSWPGRWRMPADAWAVAAALVMAISSVVLLVALGRTPPQAAGDLDRAGAAPDTRQQVLFTALDDHLAQTELLLVELMNAPDTGADLAFERLVAGDLVASGRLYRQTAGQTGAGQVTDVLDDLEAVLVEVARSPDRIDPRHLQALRLQIDEYGLLFKVRAVGDRIRSQHASAGTWRHEPQVTRTGFTW